MYTESTIAETLEDYHSLKNSLTKYYDTLDLNVLKYKKVDRDGYHPQMILSKKMFMEIKGKLEFIDNNIGVVKCNKRKCVLEARMKGLENEDIREHFDINNNIIKREFDRAVRQIYNTQFKGKKEVEKTIRKRRTKKEMQLSVAK